MHVIFNQFEEFGNPIWHYNVTGPAVEEVFRRPGRDRGAAPGGLGERHRQRRHHRARATTSRPSSRSRRWWPPRPCSARRCSGTASATTASRASATSTSPGSTTSATPTRWPPSTTRTACGCCASSTSRRAESSSRRRAPTRPRWSSSGSWASAASATCSPPSRPRAYWELDEDDVVFTVFTDSVELYRSRLAELTAERGAFGATQAAAAFAGSLERQAIDHFKELTYTDRKAIHNLKYFTWVEQQGKTYEEINAQWSPEYWRELFEDEAGRVRPAHRRLQPRGRAGDGGRGRAQARRRSLGRSERGWGAEPHAAPAISTHARPRRDPGHAGRALPGAGRARPRARGRPHRPDRARRVAPGARGTASSTPAARWCCPGS